MKIQKTKVECLSHCNDRELKIIDWICLVVYFVGLLQLGEISRNCALPLPLAPSRWPLPLAPPAGPSRWPLPLAPPPDLRPSSILATRRNADLLAAMAHFRVPILAVSNQETHEPEKGEISPLIGLGFFPSEKKQKPKEQVGIFLSFFLSFFLSCFFSFQIEGVEVID